MSFPKWNKVKELSLRSLVERYGTKYQVLGETHNGEISDYMLQKKSIISGSYFLGVAEKGYEGNFPVPLKSRRILEYLLKCNFLITLLKGEPRKYALFYPEGRYKFEVYF